MIYFARHFGYLVSGVDYSNEMQGVVETLDAHRIEHWEIFHCDFIEFNPGTQHDIVFSAGFVEHFDGPKEVFSRHLDLVKDTGFLVISLPNFRYAQKLFRLILGMKEELSSHNLAVMYPFVWRNLAQKANMEILYCDYIHTFRFWTPPDYNPYLKFLIEKALILSRLDRVPNRYFSPHILLVARKREYY